MSSAHLTRLLAAALVLASVVATIARGGVLADDSSSGIVISRDGSAFEVALIVSDRPLLSVSVHDRDAEEGELLDRIGVSEEHLRVAWRALVTN